MFWKKAPTSIHQRVQDLLSSYLDGQVTAQERALVEEHLRTCDVCRRVWGELQTTVNLVRALPQAAPARSFTWAQPPARGGPSFAWGPPLATAAALMFAFLVLGQAAGLLGLPTTPPPVPAEKAAAPQALAEAPAALEATPEPTRAAPPLGIMGTQREGVATPLPTATSVPPTATPEARASEPSLAPAKEEAPLQVPLLPWLQGVAAALAVVSGGWWLLRRRRALP